MNRAVGALNFIFMTEGNVMKQYQVPVKRYVQTMDLKDEPALIAEYRNAIAAAKPGPEIRRYSRG